MIFRLKLNFLMCDILWFVSSSLSMSIAVAACWLLIENDWLP